MSKTSKPISVEYYPDRKLAPNNLDDSRDSLHEYLFSNYGQVGSFIRRGEYYLKKLPAMPEVLRNKGSDKDSVEFITAMETYREETKAVKKFNNQAEDTRSKMFGDIYSALSQSTRDKISTATDYPNVYKEACDPLALWTIVEERLSSTTAGDKVAVKGAAKDAYNLFKQSGLMSVEDFRKGYTSRYESMVKAGWKDLTPAEQGYDIVQRLNRAKYYSLVESIENGIMSYPETPQKAFELALRWKTSRPSVGSSYAAESSRPREMPSHSIEPSRPLPASSYVTESKPRISKGTRDENGSAMRSSRSSPLNPPKSVTFSRKYSELRERAAAAGYPEGSCYECGSVDHKMNQCPQVKRSGREDAHATVEDNGQYDYDGYYDEEAYFTNAIEEDKPMDYVMEHCRNEQDMDDEEFLDYCSWIKEQRLQAEEVDVKTYAEERDVTAFESETLEATEESVEEVHATVEAEAEEAEAESSDTDDDHSSVSMPGLLQSETSSEASVADLGDVGFEANTDVAMAAMEGNCEPGTLGLDTMASKNVVSEDFGGLTGIRECRGVSFVGIGGLVTLNKMGFHSQWGPCFLRPAPCNLSLLSLGHLEQISGISISYSQAESTFTVRVGPSMYEFKRTAHNVYIHAGPRANRHKARPVAMDTTASTRDEHRGVDLLRTGQTRRAPRHRNCLEHEISQSQRQPS
jgi:hypothetical protein